MTKESDRYRIERHQPGTAPVQADDDVAREEPMEIRVGGRPIGVTMRTPGHDEELAAGFLLSEGLIRKREDLERIAHCDVEALGEGGCTVNAQLAADVAVDFATLTRHVFASSSCGICGSATIDAIRKSFPHIETDLRLSEALIHSLGDRLAQSQPTFARTGGLHAAALFDEHGTLVVSREDVGRHNAVDKVIGFALVRGLLPARRHALMVSGRASFEIVQKALAAGIPVVVAISAPSSLAVDLAREIGITLVGFLRQRGFNVYAHPERVTVP